MAEEKVDVVSQLGDVIGEHLEKQRQKAKPIPEVYSSGMRGNEVPPHLREKPKDNKGKAKGEDEVDPKTGKRIVKFTARPKTNDRVEALEKTVADLKKQLAGQGRSKLKIG